MTEMVKRAGDAVIAALKRPFGDYSPAEMKEPWNVAAGRMVILAAFDLTPAERDALAEVVRSTEVRTGGFAFYQDTVDAVLVALKERAQGGQST